jgi:signal transduction histidine kinase
MQADELEAARAEAEAGNRAKSEFLATMSHELRTPLNAVTGYADLLLAGVRGQLSPEQRADVERIKRSSHHLLSLINDILNFAKLEAGTVEFRVSDTRLAPILQSLEELMRPQIDTKSLNFLQQLPDADVVVRADEEKVRQVLVNLVTNAVKFTDSGGLVAVECATGPDDVRIVVRDTGRGIAPEHLGRIFDPFVQVDRDQTPRSQQGVGLGLSISRDLAHGMGGSLSVTSTLGEGSAFTLTLPRVVVPRTSAAELSPSDEALVAPLLAEASAEVSVSATA